jgi:hypothetical protein
MGDRDLFSFLLRSIPELLLFPREPQIAVAWMGYLGEVCGLSEVC